MLGRLQPGSLVVRVSTREGRELERLLAPPAPGEKVAHLGGAVVEATYASKDPLLLSRFAESGIPWVIDPMSVRFSTPGYLGVRAVAGLPYAPKDPLDASRFSTRIESMVRGALEFQAEMEPSMYVVPALPVRRASPATLKTFREIHHLAADLNGTLVPYRPLIAAAYPGSDVVRGQFGVFEKLDRAFAGAYILPLLFDPRSDSVEQLVAYARFLANAQSLGLPVIAGRAGSFGLVLAALGITNFDTGLGEGDSFSLTRLNYQRKDVVQEDGTVARKGGRKSWVYMAPLRTSLTRMDAESLLESPALRAQLMCTVGRCRVHNYRYALEQPRQHFVHSRQKELEEIASSKTVQARIQLVSNWLRTATDTGTMVNRIRVEGGLLPLNLRYIDNWHSVLARMAMPILTEGR